jgi:hypothetical protein
MNKNGRRDNARQSTVTLAFVCAMSLGFMLLSLGCGGEGKTAGQPQQRATGYSADLKKTLEHDDRVVSSDEEGGKLIVTVNEKWEPTDPGNKAWALGGWFDKWQRQRGDGKGGDGLEVVVRFNGQDTDRYTAAQGYQPIEAKREN